MSQENVDAVKRGLDAFNCRDLDRLLEELDPDVEWHSAFPVLLGGRRTVFRGHQGVRELIEQEDKVWAEYQVEVSEIRDLGDRVLGIGRVRSQGIESGIELDSPWCVLVDIRDGKGIRIRTYLDSEAALEAAGLRE
jgi:uncharacterized protein